MRHLAAENNLPYRHAGPSHSNDEMFDIVR